MERVTHTPGPWDWQPMMKAGKPFRGFHIIVGQRQHRHDEFVIGSAGGPDEVRAIDEANARLIAAAPDLLEMLKAISMVHKIQDCIGPARWEMLGNAIAKADGR